MSLAKYLAHWDEQYNLRLKLVGQTAKTPGYHTRMPDGTHVHDIRASADYALALLQSGEPERAARACDIIDRLLTLQDVDPVSTTYGIWSWFYEEPLEKMSPPDWNWADFIGARLSEILVEHSAQLPGALVERTRQSLGHAAWCIFRRHSPPTYTNIAIIGAVVCAAAGEMLGEARLLDYARRRIASVVACMEHHGSFVEYNSPTYTRVAIEGCDRGLRLVRDAAFRAAIDTLRRHGWQVVAEHFHPGTRQWAGPQSRSYSERLAGGTLAWIAANTGVDMGNPPPRDGAAPSCPEELVARFVRLPESDFCIQRRFIRRANGDDTIGTTWFSNDACLGSINRDTTWTQRRVLLGYFNTPAGVAMLRLRLMLNGRDFAGGYVRQVQQRRRVLSGFHFVTGTGDFHPHFGAPKDLVFQATDLRVRYELACNGAEGLQIGDDRIDLRAGSWRAAIRTAPSEFDGRPVRWELTRLEDRVCLDGICHIGAARQLDLKTIRSRIFAGVELLCGDEAAASSPIEVHQEHGAASSAWGALSVGIPLAPVAVSWDA